MDNRFRQENRIRTKAEFQELCKEKPLRSSVCTIYARTNQLSTSRLGLIVNRRIGNAVIRNRVKRLLREVFRHIKNHFISPTDLIIRVQPAVQTLSYSELYDEIVRLLSPSIMPNDERSQDKINR